MKTCVVKCSAHGLAYSLVALQEMNLACNFPSIFWNTANLIVDSAGTDGETEEEEDEDNSEENTSCVDEEENEIEDEENDEEENENSNTTKEVVKRAKKTVDYGRTAAAIGRFKSWGINVTPPNINTSGYTFLPNAENNTILYGLRGITNISTDLIKTIIKARPFTSFEDFREKVATTKVQTINLIKSGCFDSITTKSREDLMYGYLDSVSEKKKSLTIANINIIVEHNLFPKEMNDLRKIYLFNKDTKNWKDGDNFILPEKAVDFVAKHFSIDLIFNGNELPTKLWKKAYGACMAPLKEYLKDNKDDILATINEHIVNDMVKKYASGNTSKWEMESLSFYDHEHELAQLTLPTANFEDLPKKAIPSRWINTKKGDQIPIYDLQLIAGTVIDKNKLKNTITLLTPSGVVLVKLYKEQFTQFDKQISRVGEDGKKHVIEKSWFTKGTLLLVQGIRRDDNFILKKYKSSYYPVITKIDSVDDKGAPALIFSRMEEEEE